MNMQQMYEEGHGYYLPIGVVTESEHAESEEISGVKVQHQGTKFLEHSCPALQNFPMKFEQLRGFNTQPMMSMHDN